MGTDTFAVDCAGRIRAALTGRRRPIRSLADAIRVPYPSLQNYLRATNPFPAWVIARISEELDVSADWLLTGMPYRLDEELLGKALETVALLYGAPSVFDGERAQDAVAMFEYVYFGNYLERVTSLNPGKLVVSPKPGGGARWRREPPPEET